MTEVEYNNMRPGDVIFNLKNKDAHIVKEVCDGFVRWEDGGSTPSKYLKGWDYVSLMREREKPAENSKTVVNNIGNISFPFKKTTTLRKGDIIGPITFNGKNFSVKPFNGLAKVVDRKYSTNITTFEVETDVYAMMLLPDNKGSVIIKLDNDKEYPLIWREP